MAKERPTEDEGGSHVTLWGKTGHLEKTVCVGVEDGAYLESQRNSWEADVAR